ncbi:early growth response protein 1 [Nematostella vectensis]|nr:early growth response protein 1 [Nematostella vectensis]
MKPSFNGVPGSPFSTKDPLPPVLYNPWVIPFQNSSSQENTFSPKDEETANSTESLIAGQEASGGDDAKASPVLESQPFFTKYTFSPDSSPLVTRRYLEMSQASNEFKIPRYKFITEDQAKRCKDKTARETYAQSQRSDELSGPIKDQKKKIKDAELPLNSFTGFQCDPRLTTTSCVDVAHAQRFNPFNMWQPDLYDGRQGLKPGASYSPDAYVSSDTTSQDTNEKAPMHYGHANANGSTETYVIQKPTTSVTAPYPSGAMGMQRQIPFLPYPLYNGVLDPYTAAVHGVIPTLPNHPLGPNPYYWMRDSNPAQIASMHPTAIRPKPMLDVHSYSSQGCGYMWAYPSVTAMFRAAKLIPFSNGEEYEICNPPTEYKRYDSLSTEVHMGSSFDHKQRYHPLTHPADPQYYTAEHTLANGFTPITNGQMENGGYSSEVGEAVVDGRILGDGLPIQTVDVDEIVDVVGSSRAPSETMESAPPVKPSSVHSESNRENICGVCGKKYARAFTLKTHQRVHTGEKPFKCPICGRPFAQSSGLESHKRVHTGQKPYKCEVCERGFSHSSAVKNHMRTHTGEKPFQCPICNKKFADQSTVKKHERTHTGIKPFTCPECGLKFTQIGNMNKHLRKKHEAKDALKEK